MYQKGGIVMLKSKSELISFLEKRCENIAFNNDLYTQIREYMLDKYEIPTGTTMDMIARNMLDEQTEFLLFCLVDGIDVAIKSKYKKEFFSEIEIDSYTKQKMESSKIKFPIVIKCDQVSKDQWIGACNSRFFMDLRRDQLIRYNVNAQRVMDRKIKGENIIFKIIPNKIAIKAIKILMQKNLYIPTTITLNIPYDSDADFYFDENNRKLVINNIDLFNISDGYHRYLAMSELSDENPDFNYPMEIRIINFTDEKTRQFIYQEDQKTKMSRSNSRSMSINRASNNVIDRLNEMSAFDFKGQISRVDGTIDYAAMSDFIEHFYFKDKNTYTNMDIRNVANEVKEKFNALSERDSTYINKVLDFKELAVIFYVFNTESDLQKAVDIIDKALKSGVSKQFKHFKITKSLFNTISKLLTEV
jgi:hypothetical protein